MERIYLDNAATSWPKAPGMSKVIADYIDNDCVNINRTESSKVMDTFDWMYELRNNICKIYNYRKPECVVFTKNVTESLNWVIKGLVDQGDKVAVSGYEHNSVMRPLTQLKTSLTVFNDDNIEQVINKETKAVIVNSASNVTGKILSLERLATAVKKAGCLFIVDAAQGTPFIDIDFEKLGLTAVCFTGHKGLMGPQGTGGFVIRKEFANKMKVLMSGGTGTESDSFDLPTTMPERFTVGTENLVGLRGLAYSVDWVLKNKTELRRKTKEATDYFLNGLSKIDGLKIVGPSADENRTNVISITCEKDISELASILSDNGIETRVGLHCSPLAHKTEGTFPTGTLRFSPGPFTTKEQIDKTVKLVKEYVL